MSESLNNLYPNDLWTIFGKFCSIPHPSKHERKIADYVIAFAKELKLEVFEDKVGNVIIKKPATKGFENRKTVVLQGHLDMVPQKNSDTNHVFEKDPIQAYIDGEWVKAKGTTLGADNGIGAAAALAVLKSKDISHGPIEVLLTIDEETGMTGAFGLEAGTLHGDILMNLDSEDEGELYIGCAGGIDTSAEFTYTEENFPAGHIAYDVTIKGLKGGHSGLDIVLGRGNSNKLLNRFLWDSVRKFDLRLASFEGGTLRNAIPRESFAVVTIPSSKVAEFEKYVKEFEAIVKKELSATEPDMSFSVSKSNYSGKVIDTKSTHNLLNSIYSCPNGVIRMTVEMPGLVETSLNLAIVKSGNGKINVHCLLRSSVDSAKEDLSHMVESVFTLAGAKVAHEGGYPGWKPNVASPILQSMKDVYNNKYGKIPDVKAIHAGLECGIIGAVYPNLDMISFGPTIRYPHSPDEKVNVATVGKFWDYLVETLKNVPVK
ncbi:MAG: cytosol nonspecific dipeptidase [Bacteroidetes bacterium GWA2_31_9]|nr:MAG: cytosol nonspecific dipeptidase [Bacteroidetes bacterium GWA2_31_9]